MIFSFLRVLLMNTCWLVFCDGGDVLNSKFRNKYSSLLEYFEWDALMLLKSSTLKDICVKHSGLQKFGVRGEARIQRHIRNHIDFNLYGKPCCLVRIDLLQCYVIFIDCNGNVTGETTFYLAEGSETNSTFKLNQIKGRFYLVGEIRSDMWVTWFSKENLLLNGEEDLTSEEEIEEESDVSQKIWDKGKLIEEPSEHEYPKKYYERGETSGGNVEEEKERTQRGIQIWENRFAEITEQKFEKGDEEKREIGRGETYNIAVQGTVSVETKEREHQERSQEEEKTNSAKSERIEEELLEGQEVQKSFVEEKVTPKVIGERVSLKSEESTKTIQKGIQEEAVKQDDEGKEKKKKYNLQKCISGCIKPPKKN